MKSFLRKFGLISLIAFVLLAGFELYLLTVSNEYSYKRKYVEEQGDKIKVLILGHSHVEWGINPELIGDSVFNMAIAARFSTYFDAVLAERYIPTLKNLKCVIWPLAYNFQYISNIYPCLESGKIIGLSASCMYEKYMNISYEKSIPYSHWSELMFSPTSATRLFKKSKYSSSGYVGQKRSTRRASWKTQELPKKVDYENPNAPLAKEEGLSNIKRIAEVCRNAGVRLVVVTAPCYHTYVEQTTERGMREMQECVDAMRSVYPEMEYYNFMTDPRFTEDDFFNSSHLLEEGAEKFSKILKDTLNL